MDRQDVRVYPGRSTYNVGLIIQPDAIYPKTRRIHHARRENLCVLNGESLPVIDSVVVRDMMRAAGVMFLP